jgi:hypothetical protein
MVAEDSARSVPGLKYSMQMRVGVGDLVHAVCKSVVRVQLKCDGTR